MAQATVRAIGLMSGTSIDGVDAAYLETDGEDVVMAGPALTHAYPEAFRARLQAILGGGAPPDEVAEVEHDLTCHHAEAARALIERDGLAPPELVGFHGHTILHRPADRRTWQIGDGAFLAKELAAPVVFDFRTADVAAGGQGAPLVPVYHRALARRVQGPVAILNIGGVANVTWIGSDPDDILAFDTGPGNALIDDWALRHTGYPLDRDGVLAATGRVDETIVSRFLAHRYFAMRPPKSLDRDDFGHLLPHHLAPADGAATLTAITAGAVAMALDHLPAAPKTWLVTGGGRRNTILMAALQARLGSTVEPVEAIGWDGDALEAQAFAYLAVRSQRGLPLSFPGTTGVMAPQTGGRLAPA